VESVPELGRIEPAQVEGNVDVAMAKRLLEKAKHALLDGQYRKAKKLAEQSKEMAHAARSYHRKVMNELRSLEDFIEYIDSLKYDTSKAQKVLDEAKKAVLQLDYPSALRLVEDARKVLHRATFVPFPLLNKNVTIKTIIGVEKDKIIYKVRIENKSKRSLGEIVLLPAVDESMFAPVKEQMMGELVGMQAKEVTFVLSPITKNWSLGVPGHLIIGKDINLKTILECQNGTAIYKVMIHNNRSNPITDLTVNPFVPKGLSPDEESKVIEELPAKDSEVIIFDLTPYHFEEEFQPRVSRYASSYEDEFPVEWGYSPEEEEEEETAAEKVPVTGYMCPECDGPVREEDDVCPHCGVRFLSDDEEEEDEEEEEDDEEEEEDLEIDEELLELETTGFTSIKDKFKSMMFMPDIIQVIEPPLMEEEEDGDIIGETEPADEEEWSSDDETPDEGVEAGDIDEEGGGDEEKDEEEWPPEEDVNGEESGGEEEWTREEEKPD